LILAVDDEQVHLDLVTDVLTTAGYEIRTFVSASHALNFAGDTTPQLIISDINMPEMDGFQFYQQYQKRFSHRQTPFIFLSSQSDPDTIVRGLNSGADDYLQKPLHPEIIKAKVKSILRRRKQYISQKYTGLLEHMPFTKVLQFCELKHLTGWVDIYTEDFSTIIKFNGGDLQLDEDNDDLDKIFDLTKGSFTVNVQQVDYLDLHHEILTESKDTLDTEKPIGKLSGIKIQQRLFQIQTEQQDGQIVSIVVIDGRVVLKRVAATPDITTKIDLEKTIELQHLSVEKEVRAKLNGLVEKNTDIKDDETQKFHKLYDAGYDEYCTGNFSEAIKYWEEATKIKSTDKTLAINLSVVRKKLSK